MKNINYFTHRECYFTKSTENIFKQYFTPHHTLKNKKTFFQKIVYAKTNKALMFMRGITWDYVTHTSLYKL